MTNFKGQFLENYTFITFRSHYQIDAVFKIDKDSLSGYYFACIWCFCWIIIRTVHYDINFLLINKIYLLFLGYLSIIRNRNVSLNKGARSSSAGRDSFDDVKTNKKDATADRGSSGK